ncbi:hypothetical protein TWF694_003167 [Orbilia ellipsospora]|uniref:Uncharacterized protein n=1 Tax=Orbilia ellipsospora TaxID=2528407 RepID=A0AAV9X0U4_9PEZI
MSYASTELLVDEDELNDEVDDFDEIANGLDTAEAVDDDFDTTANGFTIFEVVDDDFDTTPNGFTTVEVVDDDFDMIAKGFAIVEDFDVMANEFTMVEVVDEDFDAMANGFTTVVEEVEYARNDVKEAVFEELLLTLMLDDGDAVNKLLAKADVWIADKVSVWSELSEGKVYWAGKNTT